MKKIVFGLFSLLAFATTANAQSAKGAKGAAKATETTPVKWDLDASHSSVKFAVSHLAISETEGNFKKFEGTITTPSATDVTGANISFTIDVKSVNTDNEGRDKHLLKDDFFDAEKFPTMTFVSKSFKKAKGNNYLLEGDFTMHGVKKSMKIPVKFNGFTKDPWGGERAGFKAQFVVDRTAHGMTGSTTAVGKNVSVTMNIELVKAK